MSLKRITLLIITAMIAVTHLNAQQLRASQTHYSTDDGLASNAIAYILQDDYGFIWLATWNGLSRFDGYNFYNYRTGNASHIANLHNRILSMTCDHSQNIWLNMYDGRIFALDRSIDAIINPFENVSNSEEYRTNYPLFKMSNGDILASINGVGVYKMRLDKGKTNMQLITTSQHTVRCFAEGYHDDIWVGTEKGLHRVDIGNLSIERKGLFEDEDVTALYSNGYNIYVGCRSGSIYLYSYGQEPQKLREPDGRGLLSIFVDSHGLIWFADTRYGIVKLDPTTKIERHYQQRVLVPEHDGIGGIVNETNGTVWIRMNHGGYGYYNRATDEVEYFHNDPSNPWNMSNTVNASWELPEGVIFMSTSRRGLDKLEILKSNITRTLLVPNAESTIDNEIRGMFYEKKRKLLLLGNKNNTLFVVHPDSTRTTITSDSKGTPLGRTYGISQDSKGNIWLSSKDHGLFKLVFGSGNSYTLQNYCHDPHNKYSLSSNAAYQTVEDRQGNLWVATYGGGVNVMVTDKDGKTVFLNPKNEMRRYPHNSFLKVRTIALDKNGNVWAGTTDGILIMSVKNKKVSIERLRNSDEEPDKILMSNDIVYLASDSKGGMWVGTNGGGLAHTIGQDSKGTWLFESFGSKDGLPSEEIRSITFDLNDNVWFASDHIICSYNPEKRIFTTFSNLDGVDETLCSEGAAITLPNGIILFGTLNGYYTIDRKKLVTDNASMLKLRITDFFINDEIVSPHLNDYYNYYVPEAKEVKLPNHNANFSFRFSAMNFQLQHRIHYQYMLEGYDKEWKNADKQRRANYSDVPTGTYRFKVKAFLLDSPDKYDQRTIIVHVPPYFLLSSNAIWIYMVLLLAILIFLMFWWQNHLEQQQKHKVLRLGPQEMAFVHQEDYDFVKSQYDWLEANFSNPDLKTDDLSAQSGLSRTEYSERMKELTGLSVKEFIADFRIKKSIMFLENTDDLIADIAAKAGFTDSVIFSRTFKQKVGTTPSKYREQKKKDNNQQKSQNITTEDKTDDYELID